MTPGLLGSALALMGGRLIQPVFSFFLFLISARLLTVSQFGLYVLLLGLLTLFQSLCTLGLNQVLAREIGCRPQEEGHSIASALLLSIPASIVCYGLFLALAAVLKDSGEFLGLAAIVALCLPLSCLIQLGDSIFVAHNQGRSLFRINLIEQTVRVSLSLTALIKGLELQGLIVAYVLARLLAASLTIWLFYNKRMSPPVKIDRANLRFIAGRLSVFAPMNILANLYNRADIIVLAWLLADHELGLYGCAIRIVYAGLIIPDSVIAATFPQVSRAWASQTRGFTDKVKDLMELLLAISLLLAVGLAIFAGWGLVPVFGSKYAASGRLLALMSIMLPAYSLNGQLGFLLQAVHKEKTALVLVALSTLLYFLCIIMGVLWLGLTGAVLGVLASTWLVAISYLIITGISLLHLPVWSPPVRSLALLLIGLGLMSLMVRTDSELWFGLALALIYVVALTGSGLIKALSLKRIRLAFGSLPKS